MRGPVNELHVGASDGSIERTLAVLSRGVIGIDLGTPEGATPLIISAGKRYSRIVRVLLNKGANVYIVNDTGKTALHIAARMGHLAVTKLLAKAVPDLEARTPTRGYTPLYLASTGGHPQVVRALMKAGAELDAKNSQGWTPLHLASKKGHSEPMTVLIDAGADSNSRK